MWPFHSATSKLLEVVEPVSELVELPGLEVEESLEVVDVGLGDEISPVFSSNPASQIVPARGSGVVSECASEIVADPTLVSADVARAVVRVSLVVGSGGSLLSRSEDDGLISDVDDAVVDPNVRRISSS